MHPNKCGLMWKGTDALTGNVGWHQCLKPKGHKGHHEKVGRAAAVPDKNAKFYRKVMGKQGIVMMPVDVVQVVDDVDKS